MSAKSKKRPRHTRAGMLPKAPSVIYHQTSIKESVDPKEKYSAEDS